MLKPVLMRRNRARAKRFPATAAIILCWGAFNQAARGVDQTGPGASDGVRIVMTRVPAAGAAGWPTRFDDILPPGSHVAACTLTSNGVDHIRDCQSLTPDFASAGRPDISLDAARILFVGRRTRAARLSVWEMKADGSDPRQVVALPDADITQAIYLSELFTLDADAPIPLIAFVASALPRTADEFGILHACRLDGGGVQRISYNPFGECDPCILEDGRIVVRARLPTGGSCLMSLFADGTDAALFFRGPDASADCLGPCASTGETVYFIEATQHAQPDRRTHTRALVEVQRAQSLTTRREILHGDDAEYLTPARLDSRRLLLAIRPHGQATFDLHVVNPFEASVDPVHTPTDDWHELDARIIATRPVPAGRSSVVNPEGATGYLYCLNAYLLGLPEQPRTRRNEEIKRVQVYAAANAPAPVDSPAQRLLGDAPVEPDGSFFLEVPARTPLRLRTVDAAGDTFAEMTSWIWVMPRESRGCIGCHEDRELSPPNRRVAALRQQPFAVGRDRSADIAQPED